MKIITSVVALVIIFGAVTAFIMSSRRQITTDQIGVTVNPILDLVKQVAGNDVAVKLIAPAGASPHSYEPRPQDLATIERSRLVFAVGHGFDDWITAEAKSAGSRPVVTLDQGITLLKSGESDDPHYFLSPANAKIMVGQIADSLAIDWPDHAADFQARASAYQTKLDELIATYQPQFASRQITIATFHNAFAYLTRDFGVRVATTFEEFPGQSPSPAWLVDFQKQIKSNNLKVVYAEPDFPKTALEPVASDLGITIGELDPLESNGRHTDYLSALEDNLQTILSQS